MQTTDNAYIHGQLLGERAGPTGDGWGLRSPSALCDIQLGPLGLPGGDGWGRGCRWDSLCNVECKGLWPKGLGAQTGLGPGQQQREAGPGMTLSWELAKAAPGWRVEGPDCMGQTGLMLGAQGEWKGP